MRYVVVLILFAIVSYVSTSVTALMIGRDSVVTILLSLLVGSIAGTFVVVIGLWEKLRN